MEYMKGLPDKAFDLAIVDPPYGLGMGSTGYAGGFAKTKKFYGIKQWDACPPNEEYFKELMRVSKNQIIWGANHFIEMIPFNSSCWIIWDKDVTGDFADAELAWTSFKTAVRKVKITWNGFRQENMTRKQQRIHPTEKPYQLYQWLFENYADKEDRIFDSHGGSMSSAIAAKKLGYNLTVCEIDEDYYKQAIDRFNKETYNPLFDLQTITQSKLDLQ